METILRSGDFLCFAVHGALTWEFYNTFILWDILAVTVSVFLFSKYLLCHFFQFLNELNG